MSKKVQRILILDDDAEFAESLAQLLPTHYHVKTAFSLKQATDQLARYPFECVVSDFVLAEHDGFEFLKALHTYENPPKIVFMTAFANKDMAISLLNQGIHGLLEKPFSISTLTELIERRVSAKPVKSWRLDPAMRVIITLAGNFELTEVEFKIVSYMLSQSDRWISREELIEQVWGKSSISRNVLDTHLTNLKRKVPSLKEAIKVVRGRGYLLEETPQ
ncbi:MAG: response regulator transcription factor [Bdellovibrionales bacterium]|nr:response regulator transcription factor [Bdellovibrionales bacterium]